MVESAASSFPSATPSHVFSEWTASQKSTGSNAVISVKCLPRTGRHEARSRQQIPSRKVLASAVRGLNSVDFLQELVRVKSTVGEVKYSTIPTHAATLAVGEDDFASTRTSLAPCGTEIRGGSFGRRRGMKENDNDNGNDDDASMHMTSCEYNGKLWFLPSKLIRFREVIRVVTDKEGMDKSSDEPKAATVYCETQFQRGQDWVDCSRVKCTLASSLSLLPKGGLVTSLKDGNDNLHVHIDSELLVQIPLAGGAIRRKINLAFQSAVFSFLEGTNQKP